MRFVASVYVFFAVANSCSWKSRFVVATAGNRDAHTTYVSVRLSVRQAVCLFDYLLSV